MPSFHWQSLGNPEVSLGLRGSFALIFIIISFRKITQYPHFRFWNVYTIPALEEGNGNPLQDSCLENPVDKGAWWAIVHGLKKSDMTDWLSTAHTSHSRSYDHSNAVKWIAELFGGGELRKWWPLYWVSSQSGRFSCVTAGAGDGGVSYIFQTLP